MLGTWNGIKIRFPASGTRTKKNMPWALLEFLWRRKYHGDLFGGLLKTLRDVQFIRTNRNPPFLTEVVIGGDSDNDEEASDQHASDNDREEQGVHQEEGEEDHQDEEDDDEEDQESDEDNSDEEYVEPEDLATGNTPSNEPESGEPQFLLQVFRRRSRRIQNRNNTAE